MKGKFSSARRRLPSSPVRACTRTIHSRQRTTKIKRPRSREPSFSSSSEIHIRLFRWMLLTQRASCNAGESNGEGPVNSAGKTSTGTPLKLAIRSLSPAIPAETLMSIGFA